MSVVVTVTREGVGMDAGEAPEDSSRDPEYRLRWQPTRADLEAAIRQWRTPSQRRMARTLGALYLLGGVAWLVGFRGADAVLGILLVLIGLALLTDWLARALRRWMVFRRNPYLFQEWEAVVSPSGVIMRCPSINTESRTGWAAWGSWAPTDHGLALFGTREARSRITVLARRGLANPGDWPGLVELVASRVARR